MSAKKSIHSQISFVHGTEAEFGKLKDAVRDSANGFKYLNSRSPPESRKLNRYNSLLETIEESDSQSANHKHSPSVSRSSVSVSTALDEEYDQRVLMEVTSSTSWSTVSSVMEDKILNTSQPPIETLYYKSDWNLEDNASDPESTMICLEDFGENIRRETLTHQKKDVLGRNKVTLSTDRRPSVAPTDSSVAMLKYACHNYHHKKTFMEQCCSDPESPGGDQMVKSERRQQSVRPYYRPPMYGSPDELPEILQANSQIERNTALWKENTTIPYYQFEKSDDDSIEINFKESITNIKFQDSRICQGGPNSKSPKNKDYFDTNIEVKRQLSLIPESGLEIAVNKLDEEFPHKNIGKGKLESVPQKQTINYFQDLNSGSISDFDDFYSRTIRMAEVRTDLFEKEIKDNISKKVKALKKVDPVIDRDHVSCEAYTNSRVLISDDNSVLLGDYGPTCQVWSPSNSSLIDDQREDIEIQGNSQIGHCFFHKSGDMRGLHSTPSKSEGKNALYARTIKPTGQSIGNVRRELYETTSSSCDTFQLTNFTSSMPSDALRTLPPNKDPKLEKLLPQVAENSELGIKEIYKNNADRFMESESSTSGMISNSSKGSSTSLSPENNRRKLNSNNEYSNPLSSQSAKISSNVGNSNYIEFLKELKGCIRDPSLYLQRCIAVSKDMEGVNSKFKRTSHDPSEKVDKQPQKSIMQSNAALKCNNLEVSKTTVAKQSKVSKGSKSEFLSGDGTRLNKNITSNNLNKIKRINEIKETNNVNTFQEQSNTVIYGGLDNRVPMRSLKFEKHIKTPRTLTQVSSQDYTRLVRKEIKEKGEILETTKGNNTEFRDIISSGNIKENEMCSQFLKHPIPNSDLYCSEEYVGKHVDVTNRKPGRLLTEEEIMCWVSNSSDQSQEGKYNEILSEITNVNNNGKTKQKHIDINEYGNGKQTELNNSLSKIVEQLTPIYSNEMELSFQSEDELPSEPVPAIIKNMLRNKIKDGFIKGIASVSDNSTDPLNSFSSEVIEYIVDHLIKKLENKNLSKLLEDDTDHNTLAESEEIAMRNIDKISANIRSFIVASEDLEDLKTLIELWSSITAINKPEESEKIRHDHTSTLAAYIGSETSTEKSISPPEKRKVTLKKNISTSKTNAKCRYEGALSLTKPLSSAVSFRSKNIASLIQESGTSIEEYFSDTPVFDIIQDTDTAVSLQLDSEKSHSSISLSSLPHFETLEPTESSAINFKTLMNTTEKPQKIKQNTVIQKSSTNMLTREHNFHDNTSKIREKLSEAKFVLDDAEEFRAFTKHIETDLQFKPEINLHETEAHERKEQNLLDKEKVRKFALKSKNTSLKRTECETYPTKPQLRNIPSSTDFRYGNGVQKQNNLTQNSAEFSHKGSPRPITNLQKNKKVPRQVQYKYSDNSPAFSLKTSRAQTISKQYVNSLLEDLQNCLDESKYNTGKLDNGKLGNKYPFAGNITGNAPKNAGKNTCTHCHKKLGKLPKNISQTKTVNKSYPVLNISTAHEPSSQTDKFLTRQMNRKFNEEQTTCKSEAHKYKKENKTCSRKISENCTSYVPSSEGDKTNGNSESRLPLLSPPNNLKNVHCEYTSSLSDIKSIENSSIVGLSNSESKLISNNLLQPRSKTKQIDASLSFGKEITEVSAPSTKENDKHVLLASPTYDLDICEAESIVQLSELPTVENVATRCDSNNHLSATTENNEGIQIDRQLPPDAVNYLDVKRNEQPSFESSKKRNCAVSAPSKEISTSECSGKELEAGKNIISRSSRKSQNRTKKSRSDTSNMADISRLKGLRCNDRVAALALPTPRLQNERQKKISPRKHKSCHEIFSLTSLSRSSNFIRNYVNFSKISIDSDLDTTITDVNVAEEDSSSEMEVEKNVSDRDSRMDANNVDVEFGEHVLVGTNTEPNIEYVIPKTTASDKTSVILKGSNDEKSEDENPIEVLGVSEVKLSLKNSGTDKTVNSEGGNVQIPNFIERRDSENPSSSSDFVQIGREDGYDKLISATSMQLLELCVPNSVSSASLNKTEATSQRSLKTIIGYNNIMEEGSRDLPENLNNRNRIYHLNIEENKLSNSHKPVAIIHLSLENLLKKLPKEPAEVTVTTSSSCANENTRFETVDYIDQTSNCLLVGQTLEHHLNKNDPFLSGSVKSVKLNTDSKPERTCPKFAIFLGTDTTLSKPDVNTSDINISVIEKSSLISSDSKMQNVVFKGEMSNYERILQNENISVDIALSQIKSGEHNQNSEMSLEKLNFPLTCGIANENENDSLPDISKLKNPVQIELATTGNSLKISVTSHGENIVLSTDTENCQIQNEVYRKHFVTERTNLLHAKIIYESVELYLIVDWERLSYICTCENKVDDNNKSRSCPNMELDLLSSSNVSIRRSVFSVPSSNIIEIIPNISHCKTTECQTGQESCIHDLTTPDTLKGLAAVLTHVGNERIKNTSNLHNFEELSSNASRTTDSLEDLFDTMTNLSQDDVSWRSDIQFLEICRNKIAPVTETLKESLECSMCEKNSFNVEDNLPDVTIDSMKDSEFLAFRLQDPESCIAYSKVDDFEGSHESSDNYNELLHLKDSVDIRPDSTSDDASFQTSRNGILENYTHDVTARPDLQIFFEDMMKDAMRKISDNSMNDRLSYKCKMGTMNNEHTYEKISEASSTSVALNVDEENCVTGDFVTYVQNILKLDINFKNKFNPSNDVLHLDAELTQRLVKRMTAELTFITKDEMEEYIAEVFGRDLTERLLNTNIFRENNEEKFNEADRLTLMDKNSGHKVQCSVSREAAFDIIKKYPTNQQTSEIVNLIWKRSNAEKTFDASETNSTVCSTSCISDSYEESLNIVSDIKTKRDNKLEKNNVPILKFNRENTVAVEESNPSRHIVDISNNIKNLIETKQMADKMEAVATDVCSAVIVEDIPGSSSQIDTNSVSLPVVTEAVLAAGAGDATTNISPWPTLDDFVRTGLSNNLVKKSSSLSVVVSRSAESIPDQRNFSTNEVTENISSVMLSENLNDNCSSISGRNNSRPVPNESLPISGSVERLMNKILVMCSFSKQECDKIKLRNPVLEGTASVSNLSRQTKTFATVYLIVFSLIFGGLMLPSPFI